MEEHKLSKRIALVSTDNAFIKVTKTAFGASDNIELVAFEKQIDQIHGELHNSEASVVIVDLDATKLTEIEALKNVMKRLAGRVPVIVITQEFNAVTVRVLIQMQVADFLEKPVTTSDLVRSCIRALKDPGDTEKMPMPMFMHSCRRPVGWVRPPWPSRPHRFCTTMPIREVRPVLLI